MTARGPGGGWNDSLPKRNAVACRAMDADQLRSRIHQDMPRVIDELSRLVAIPSIGYAGYDPANVRASAELTRDILRDAGVGAELLEIEGGHPAVFGSVPGDAIPRAQHSGAIGGAHRYANMTCSRMLASLHAY